MQYLIQVFSIYFYRFMIESVTQYNYFFYYNFNSIFKMMYFYCNSYRITKCSKNQHTMLFKYIFRSDNTTLINDIDNIEDIDDIDDIARKFNVLVFQKNFVLLVNFQIFKI